MSKKIFSIELKNGKIKSNKKLSKKDEKYWKNSLKSLSKSIKQSEERMALAKKKGTKTAAQILDFILLNGLILAEPDFGDTSYKIVESEDAEDKLHEFLYET